MLNQINDTVKPLIKITLQICDAPIQVRAYARTCMGALHITFPNMVKNP